MHYYCFLGNFAFFHGRGRGAGGGGHAANGRRANSFFSDAAIWQQLLLVV